MLTQAQIKTFTGKLLAWHRSHNHRSLPWKGEKDPYKIWLSEVILQQTRALQGLPYYASFINAYPTIRDLANAPEDDVFRLWQGLGYYNRCKNMLATARYIAYELGGIFPANHAEILNLKGVGSYTAAAIASFAFGLPYAVVDGNVYRVLSRYFGISTAIDSSEGKQQFASLAQELLDKQHSASYNQAIMDLGATICLPANPLCSECPFHSSCYAFKKSAIDLLPVKSKKIKIRERHFNYIFIIAADKVWVQKRESGDIWENLHQPYLIETPTAVSELQLREKFLLAMPLESDIRLEHLGTTKQRLTHQQLFFEFYLLRTINPNDIPLNGGMWLSISELKKLAFPKTLVSFLKNNLYF